MQRTRARLKKEVFAYSPLSQTNYPGSPGLSFTAIYDGKTLAVDSLGSIYEGSVKVTVDWTESSSNVNSHVRDLKNVSNGSLFEHSGQAVELIVFDDLTASQDNWELSGTEPARVRYSGSPQVDVPIAGDTVMAGKFVGVSVDGPRAVIGTWKIMETGGVDIQGAFGAELVP